MIVTKHTRRWLAIRRDRRRMEAAGYRLHEVDWEILRGGRQTEVIIDVKISADGKHVWTKLGKPGDKP